MLKWTSGGGNDIYIDNLFIGNEAELSVSDLANIKSVSVYPNPTNGEVKINTDLGRLELVVVKDITGKVVATITPNATEASISLKDSKAGVYIVSATMSNGETENIRIIKN